MIHALEREKVNGVADIVSALTIKKSARIYAFCELELN
jgi:hypothetical protein